jgi:hypothetical protein
MFRPRTSGGKPTRPATATTFRRPSKNTTFLVTNFAPNFTYSSPITPARQNSPLDQKQAKIYASRPASTEPTLVITTPKSKKKEQEPKQDGFIMISGNRAFSPTKLNARRRLGVKGRNTPIRESTSALSSPTPRSSTSHLWTARLSHFDPWSPTTETSPCTFRENDAVSCISSENEFETYWTERDDIEYSPRGSMPEAKTLKNGILPRIPKLPLRSLTSASSTSSLLTPRSHRVDASQEPEPVEPVLGDKVELTQRELVLRSVERGEIKSMSEMVNEYFNDHYKNPTLKQEDDTLKHESAGVRAKLSGKLKPIPTDFNMLIRQIMKNNMLITDLEEWQERLERLKRKMVMNNMLIKKSNTSYSKR